jgi:hypothetical protein
MILRSGVPLGSVLSLALFNFVVSDCPVLWALVTSYADNFNILVSDPNILELS